MDLTRKKITANDGALLVVWDSRNAGTPVVFVHGFPETHICWNPLIDAFDSHEIRPYRLIVYDLRGFGESSRTGEASLNRFYYDHDTIISKLELKRYHLVGHDWGGAIALHVARFKPETLLSLAVMNTNYWKTDVLGMWHMIFFNIPFLPTVVFRTIPDRLFKFGMLGAFVDRNRLTLAARDSYLQMFQDRETTRYWTKLYRNMGRSLIIQKSRGLKRLALSDETALPVRSNCAYQTDISLIWGEKDRFNPIWICRDMEKQLKKRGASVSVNFIAHSGHFVQEEQPEQVAACLIQNWKKTSSENKSA
ncbi:MAG: alpha/beta hydrolase [Desulfobacterales bacterium]|nr:MAG: alpha/beta hydrolase [Desulfobacterales bacterium]